MSDGKTIQEQMTDLGNLLTSLGVMHDDDEGTFTTAEKVKLAQQVTHDSTRLAISLLISAAVPIALCGSLADGHEFLDAVIRDVKQQFEKHYADDTGPLAKLRRLADTLKALQAMVPEGAEDAAPNPI